MQRGCPNGTRSSECETSDNNLNSPRSPSGMSAPNGSSMVDPIEAEILWRTQSSRQDEMIWPSGNNSWHRVESIAENETATSITRTETIPQLTPDPIIESDYFPGFDELEHDAGTFHNCYSDGRGPDIPIGLSPSNPENENYLKELAISSARY